MRVLLISSVFHLFLASTGSAKSYGDFDTVVWHRCYDGDTCTFSIPGLHPLLGEKIGIRLAGVDTPEIRGRCPREKELAKKAKELVVRLLENAQIIRLLNVQRGKYFRIVADIWVDGVLLSEVLIGEGLAYPYDGGTKRGWC